MLVPVPVTSLDPASFTNILDSRLRYSRYLSNENSDGSSTNSDGSSTNNKDNSNHSNYSEVQI